ncbi:hypothetical protein HZD82_25425, partial [Pantoea agglomerans]|nr:hypothetical protein [Pantoea agglomerans]
QNGGMSLSSITSMLGGGDKAVSANSMTNAAGVMQYCVEHNSSRPVADPSSRSADGG